MFLVLSVDKIMTRKVSRVDLTLYLEDLAAQLDIPLYNFLDREVVFGVSDSLHS